MLRTSSRHIYIKKGRRQLLGAGRVRKDKTAQLSIQVDTRGKTLSVISHSEGLPQLESGPVDLASHNSYSA